MPLAYPTSREINWLMGVSLWKTNICLIEKIKTSIWRQIVYQSEPHNNLTWFWQVHWNHRYLFYTLNYTQIWLYLFFCSNFCRFGHWELFQPAFLLLWHITIIVDFVVAVILVLTYLLTQDSSVYVVYFLFQSWNETFLQGSPVTLLGNGIKN